MATPEGWSALHVQLLTLAFQEAAGRAETGTVAFVRCLAPEVVEALAADRQFAPSGWRVRRVATTANDATRTITADQAVELREAKHKALLLLVDTEQAGAGMDGIYSAAQEIDEESLFSHARDLAGRELANRDGRAIRVLAERAVKTARGRGSRYSVSHWVEFDYLTRIAAENTNPLALLHLIGLWPADSQSEALPGDTLRWSRQFVDRLLSVTASGQTPAQRVTSLRLLDPTAEQLNALERFLRASASKPLRDALHDLASKPNLWVHALRLEEAADSIQRIELTLWRNAANRIQKWSGLTPRPGDEDLAELVLDEEAERAGTHAKLEVRWKARPETLVKDAVEYLVVVQTDMEQEIASQQVSHSGKNEEKCRFTFDDFQLLDENALVAARVFVSVAGAEKVEPQSSEEFTIRFGDAPDRVRASVATRVRTLSEGVINLADRAVVTALASDATTFREDAKGFVLVRTQEDRKSYRIFRPPLIREVERRWVEQQGRIGRWRVKVRTSGARATEPEFIAMDATHLRNDAAGVAAWEKTVQASKRLADRFALRTGVGQLYDQEAKSFDIAKGYLAAWQALLEIAEPQLALANTIEVQLLSGQTVGVIVLPSHPLRVAWQCAYDNLVLYARYDENAKPKEIVEEFQSLDGSMCPVLLPGLRAGESFVFADTLGFHAAAMVPDYILEPKAAVAILARALGAAEAADATSALDLQSAEVLSNEIAKYYDSHNAPRLMHVHALRPGDGMTVARALGSMLAKVASRGGTDGDENTDAAERTTPSFVLELYPSREQQGIAGRFIGEAREKRRSGAGVLAPEDRWMLESTALPGGINLPRLRWARKEGDAPQSAAHLALAFDTFESKVALREGNDKNPTRPLQAYGLVSSFERVYSCAPAPSWVNAVPHWNAGERHPAGASHTERLVRLQEALQRTVARHLGNAEGEPVVRTNVSPEKSKDILALHKWCDWVITLDRNAGVEYFDSPLDDRGTYDAYVIDVVPEREDLGCLQLITSTSNLAEMRGLLEASMLQLGVRQNHQYTHALLEELKALSGRLAIQLTGSCAPGAELVALALAHANCRVTDKEGGAWFPLENGILIAVDEIADLIPPLRSLSAAPGNSAGEEASPPPNQRDAPTSSMLLFVSILPRKGISIRFADVRFHDPLRPASDPEILRGLEARLADVRRKWNEWFGIVRTPATFRALRIGRLARVLRFYADRAHRHYLTKERYERVLAEINRMYLEGADYRLDGNGEGDVGWIFSGEYSGAAPVQLTPPGRDTRIFISGVELPGLESLAPIGDSAHRVPPLGAGQFSSAPLPATAPSVTPASPGATPSTQHIDEDATTTTSAALHSQSELTAQANDSDVVTISLGTEVTTGEHSVWNLSIKGNPHLLMAGLPGMGKTTSLINICQQMVAQKVWPIVFSYHEDIDQLLESLGLPIRFVDFDGLGFNPLAINDRSARNLYLDVAASLRDIFSAIYPELGDVQTTRLREAIVSSYMENGWAARDANLSDLKEPQFRRFLEILHSDPKPDQGQRTLLGRLGELDDYGFFDASATERSIWGSDAITIVRIHSTQNETLQRAFANLIFYGLYKEMFRRGVQQRITHAILFDEAHRAARLKLMGTMAKECRKYGISLLLASQEAKDFQTSLYSAVANYLVLRLIETDARALVRNVAPQDQERFYIDKIKQMERFRALFFQEGRKRPLQILLSQP